MYIFFTLSVLAFSFTTRIFCTQVSPIRNGIMGIRNTIFIARCCYVFGCFTRYNYKFAVRGFNRSLTFRRIAHFDFDLGLTIGTFSTVKCMTFVRYLIAHLAFTILTVCIVAALHDSQSVYKECNPFYQINTIRST